MKFYLKLFTLTIFSLLNTSVLIAQKTINGIIIDRTNAVPLEWVNIYVKNVQNYGTVSNQEGIFTLKLNEDMSDDTLVISQIGFETQEIPIPSIHNNITIKMNRVAYALDLVTIYPQDVLKELLRSVRNKIPVNMPTSAHRMKAYYYEYSISDERYSEQIESIVTIEDKKYGSKEENAKIYVDELKKTEDTRGLPSHLSSSIGKAKNKIKNLYLSLNFPRKTDYNYFDNVLNENFLSKVELQFLGKKTMGFSTFIKLGFKNGMLKIKSNNGKTLYWSEGEIIIDENDLALIEITFGRDKEDSFSVIRYHKKGHKYYPAFMRTVYSYNYNQQKNFYLNSRMLVFQSYIDNKDHFENKNKKYLLKPDQYIRDSKCPENEVFWKEFNRIEFLPAKNVKERDTNKFNKGIKS